MFTKRLLKKFETRVRNTFLKAKIRAPIHLSRGNEDQLIEIFKSVKPGDWVYSTHRCHYHALLHDLGEEWVEEEINAGRSMHLMSDEHRFVTSSIVCGCVPIAVGAAIAIKMDNSPRHVWCFVGDMAYRTGIFAENYSLAHNFNLPITFVVEDNGFSTNTPTDEVWGLKDYPNPIPIGEIRTFDEWENGKLLYYRYERVFPHINAGKWVIFK